MAKEEMQAIADLLKPINEKLNSIGTRLISVEQGQTKIELKIENEIDRTIKTIGDKYLDLNRKLIEKISLDSRVETLEHKVSALEYVVENK